jgi:hypothetical protein
MKKHNKNTRFNSVSKKAAATAFAMLVSVASVFAQDGAAGITEATTQVASYFGPVGQLVMAIGAVMGLIGAVKVYNKMQAGDPDTGKSAASWFGACVFLVTVGFVLSSFFGVA